MCDLCVASHTFLKEHGFELCIPNITQNVNIKKSWQGCTILQCTRAKGSYSGLFTPSQAPGPVYMYFQMLIRSRLLTLILCWSRSSFSYCTVAIRNSSLIYVKSLDPDPDSPKSQDLDPDPGSGSLQQSGTFRPKLLRSLNKA